MTALRFGVHTPPQNTSWRELRETWAAVEAAGFDTAWTFDHFYPIFADPAGPCLEGWTTLAALGALTPRLEIGVLVTGNTYRHPAVLAKMAATVDQITGGRLILGLGAAWFELEHAAYGIPFPAVGERIPSKLRRGLQSLQRALVAGHGGEVGFDVDRVPTAWVL